MPDRVIITIHLPIDATKFSGILMHMSKAFPGCYMRNEDLTGFAQVCEKIEEKSANA